MDIKTVFVDQAEGIDLAMFNHDLASDAGLETAVIISLFTDRQAKKDDLLPLGQTDRRGWWADDYADKEFDQIGSRLWLLRVSKQLQASLNLARLYAEEALEWLVEDGIAKSIHVETFIARFEVMGMKIEIEKPDGVRLPYRFELLWRAM